MRSYQIHRLQWADLTIEIRFYPDWSEAFRTVYGHAMAHLEIDAAGHPLPFTETGYRSVFERPDAIDAEGGPVAFVLDWLERAAQSPEWSAQQARARQLCLF